MAKEKGFNPVQAQRKADKAKEIKKGKAEVQARRNERLAKRNPEGIQRQVDELKKIGESGGKLTRHEEQVLEGLEKELKAVIKAREALGDKAPQFSSRPPPPPREGGDRGALGKRRRGYDDDGAVVGGGGGRRGRESDSDSDEVPDDVRAIPMPRDTPPPIPKEVLDKWWARRRAKRGGAAGGGRGGGHAGGAGSSANAEPLVNDRGLGGSSNGGGGGGGGSNYNRNDRDDDDKAPPRQNMRLPQRPPAEPKVVYEAKPVVRNLLKEATSAFVPAAVATKMAMGKGEGGKLMEPEEADRLEREGYIKTKTAAAAGAGDATEQEARRLHQVTLEEADEED